MTEHNSTEPAQTIGTAGGEASADPSRPYAVDVFRAIEQLQRQLDDHTATLHAHTQAVARLDAELRQVKALIQQHGPED